MVRRFEMWIGTVMSPAVVHPLPVRVTRTAVRHDLMYSMLIDGRRDVVDRLERCGVRILDIRQSERPASSGAVASPAEGADPGGPGR